MIAIQMTGEKALIRFFDRLPLDLKKRAMRQTMRAGGAVLIKQIKINIGSMVGVKAASREGRKRTVSTIGKFNFRVTTKKTSLRQSIIQRVRTSQKNGFYTVVGGRYPDGNHAHLVERGHRIVTTSGKDTGKRTRPIPFQRRAEATAARAILNAQAAKMRQFMAKQRTAQTLVIP